MTRKVDHKWEPVVPMPSRFTRREDYIHLGDGVVAARWRVPAKVMIEDGDLLYRWGWDEWKIATVDERTLYDFVGLADLPASEFGQSVKEYAERWGVFELCRHELPCCHPAEYLDSQWPDDSFDHCAVDQRKLFIPSEKPERSTLPASRRGKARKKEIYFVERLTSWRFWASQAKALLNVAAKTYQNKPIAPQEWAILVPTLPKEARAFDRAFKNAALRADERKQWELRLQTLLDQPLPWLGGKPWKQIAAVLNHWQTLGRPQLLCSTKENGLGIFLTAGPSHGWLSRRWPQSCSLQSTELSGCWCAHPAEGFTNPSSCPGEENTITAQDAAYKLPGVTRKRDSAENDSLRNPALKEYR
jgi:hypothetical protein